MNVKTSFLNGELEEEIYMKQPEGIVVFGEEEKVCRLVKSFYGLKQAHNNDMLNLIKQCWQIDSKLMNVISVFTLKILCIMKSLFVYILTKCQY